MLFMACTAKRFRRDCGVKSSAFQIPEPFPLFSAAEQEELVDDDPIDL